ncbi:MAG TPA: DUF378 domain-containing protein [Clostridia bacterium]|nr:DUF378 domain-containing protein [Clostridia bacterium]
MITVIAMILMIIGAFNWFSVGVFDFNFVDWIFTSNAYIGARILYGIIGVAALWLVFYLAYNKFSGRRINAPESVAGRNRHMSNNVSSSEEY